MKQYTLSSPDGREWVAIPTAYQCLGFWPWQWYWRIEMHCRASVDDQEIALHMDCYEQQPQKRTRRQSVAAACEYLTALGFVRIGNLVAA